MEKLTEGQLSDALQGLPDWNLDAGSLVREWKFADFKESMVFVNHVAVKAEAAGHHPDIEIHYNKVKLVLVTHDAGGITQSDVAMAEGLSRDI